MKKTGDWQGWRRVERGNVLNLPLRHDWLREQRDSGQLVKEVFSIKHMTRGEREGETKAEGQGETLHPVLTKKAS